MKRGGKTVGTDSGKKRVKTEEENVSKVLFIPEMVGMILGKLKPEELMQVRRVCSVWYAQAGFHLRKLQAESELPTRVTRFRGGLRQFNEIKNILVHTQCPRMYRSVEIITIYHFKNAFDILLPVCGKFITHLSINLAGLDFTSSTQVYATMDQLWIMVDTLCPQLTDLDMDVRYKRKKSFPVDTEFGKIRTIPWPKTFNLKKVKLGGNFIFLFESMVLTFLINSPQLEKVNAVLGSMSIENNREALRSFARILWNVVTAPTEIQQNTSFNDRGEALIPDDLSHEVITAAISDFMRRVQVTVQFMGNDELIPIEIHNVPRIN